ncbi:hypothetical protein FisN_3Hh286 [Fistulifera solaris]|jgi:hypothetical protein|uniref:HMG box domain-containing protein n=1 Tax=Fistulifera solaris TaxID=1519565 RepID=A0A1Z5JQU6_FISSO|nr:hypothetical protein FisN_3Hh286 [Fistulifera solaris]|eukprot:GAX16232.1 hypothetical protein FisN_3Hh286 [Fistulifera solaris]
MKEKCVSIAKMAIIDDNEISEIAGTRLAIMHDDSSSGASNATGRACDKMTPVPHSSVSLQTDSSQEMKNASNKHTEKKEKTKKKFKKEEGRPKRPLSAYNVFFQYARVKLLNGEDCTEVRQEELEAMWLTTKPSSVGKRSHRKSHGKISFREMATMVASKWNSLDEKTRSVLKLRAKIDRDRYNVEMEIWKQKGAGPTDVYQGLAIVTPESRKQLIEREIAFYHATTSSQGLLPALIDHTMYPQQHGAPLHTMPVPSFSTPVMYQPQSHYSASHLHPVRKENVSAFHVPQVNRSETSPMPLTTSYSTVLTPVVQTGPPAGCYYQSSPFTVVQPTVPNHCIAAPPLPFGTAMMERPLTHSITPNGIVGSKDTLSSSNKTGVDHNIYSEEIGALSDDEDDLFESFE